MNESRTEGWVRTGGMAIAAWPGVALAILGLAAIAFGFWPLALIPVAVFLYLIDDLAALIDRAMLCLAGLTALYALTVPDAWHNTSVAIVGALVVLWFGARAARWWHLASEREHYATYLEPLHWALGFAFGLKATDLQLLRPEDWLAGVKPELLDAEGAIVVRLPTPRVPKEEQRQEVERVLAEKLALKPSEIKAEWRLDANNRHLHIFRARPKPTVPEVVPWDDEWRDLLSRNKADRWYVGRTVGGRPYWLDPQQDNPHILLSCLTGWGKTNAMGVIIADHLHRGFEVVICDAKFGSMPHFADLPGVTYARTMREIHEVLIRCGTESERRRTILGDAPWDKPPKFDRLLIIVEETNTTVDELTAFWKEERAWLMHEAKENGERIFLAPSSPALRSYRQLGYMGREIRMNLLVISQRAEANAVGGSAIRNQLGTKVLGWPEIPDWNMHAKAHPFRQTTGKPGHSFIVRLGKVDEVQWTFAERGDLRDWALSGRPAVSTIGLPSSHENEKPSHLGAQGGSFLGTDDRPSEPEDPDASPITLRQAVEEGVVEAPLSSVQRWSRPSMPNGFPAPIGENSRSAKLYDRNALRSWWSLYRSEVNADDQRTK